MGGGERGPSSPGSEGMTSVKPRRRWVHSTVMAVAARVVVRVGGSTRSLRPERLALGRQQRVEGAEVLRAGPRVLR